MVGKRHRAGLALALICAAVAGGSTASAQEPTPVPTLEPDGVVAPGGNPLLGLRQPGDELRLSNETTVTRWAYASRQSVLRTRPSSGARRITRLRFASGSRSGEIYGVLRGRVDSRGHTWLQVRIPGRRNGRVGWALASAFADLQLVRTRLIVNRSTLRATLYRRGRRIFRAPVGVGKRSTPTPKGHFYIDRKDGAVLGPVYGARVLFTNGYARISWPGGSAVALHGTNQPGLVPGRPSHGCIRLRNRDVKRLARLLPLGTPVQIR